jgi:ferredoxin
MVKGEEITVDHKKCIGCGMCISTYDELFKFDKEGKSEVISSGECEDCELQEVVDVCPHEAITKK